MQEPSKGVAEGARGPPPRRGWLNIVVPMVPILIAVVAAFAAGKFHGGNVRENHITTTMSPTLYTGETAPDFTLSDAHGKTFTLSSTNGAKSTLIVFYNGYDCSGCVRHLRDLADHHAEFTENDSRIVAISADTPEHSRDSIRDHGDFPFPLLSDSDHKVAGAYRMMIDGAQWHGVFLVDAKGKIRFEMRSDHPYDNTRALLERVRKLKNAG